MRLSRNTKAKIVKTLSHPAVGRLVARAFGDRVPSSGYVFDTGSPLITPETKALLFWNFYERAEIRFIDQYLRPDLDVVELGGSLGVVTCHIRRRLDASRRVVCVEANPNLAARLSRNLEINSLRDEVSIVEKAIDYDPSGRERVMFDSGVNSLSGATTDAESAGVSVVTTTLAKILDEHGINTYVLVSDIEGAEAGIVRYERDALRRCEQMIIELHDTTLGGEAIDIERMCRAFVTDHGFRLRDRHREVCVFERR